MKNKLSLRGLQYRIRKFEEAVRCSQSGIVHGISIKDRARFAREVEQARQAIIAASFYER